MKSRVFGSVDVTTESRDRYGKTTSKYRNSGFKQLNAVDSQNTLWPSRHRRGLSAASDIGGNFRSNKINVKFGFDTIDLSTRPAFGLGPLTGTFCLAPTNEYSRLIGLGNIVNNDSLVGHVLNETPNGLGAIGLSDQGAVAVERCMPTNPVVDLSTAIAEFAGAKKLFSLPGKSGSASGEYLNVQLGVLPVVSDIKALWEAVTTQEKVIQQFERDSGKLIRRRYEFPTKVETKTVKLTNKAPGYLGVLPSGSFVSLGELVTTTTTSERLWFSGAFTYYLPKEGWRRKLSHWERLYGIKPGLETVWNVIPLSFVADYFGTIGSVAHNVDAFANDGLVMPYGYMMQTVETTEHHVWTGRVMKNGNWSTHTVEGEIIRSHKRRVRANPFGFGLLDSDLNLRQLSIMAALGLNRK